jgi:hypothetical protein
MAHYDNFCEQLPLKYPVFGHALWESIHDASLTHTNAMSEGRYAPVAVNREPLWHLLNVSQNPDVLTFDDFITVRANRDTMLRMPIRGAHAVIFQAAVALTVQTLGDEEGIC